MVDKNADYELLLSNIINRRGESNSEIRCDSNIIIKIWQLAPGW